jgi:hypothetical protein
MDRVLSGYKRWYLGRGNDKQEDGGEAGHQTDRVGIQHCCTATTDDNWYSNTYGVALHKRNELHDTCQTASAAYTRVVGTPKN